MTERLTGGAGQQPRLLGVFAHPDDETFCAGGAFARYAKDGAEIMVVSATRGQSGQIRDARVATRRTVAAVREAELRRACEQLGVTHVECWDYLDGALAEADFTTLTGEIVQRIREFRPEVVISFGPDGGYGHPDHITISAAATQACRQAGDPASYPGQLAGGLAPHRPARLYHSHFPQQDVLLMDHLANWLTSRPDRFAGTMDFVHSLLLMAAEAGTMRYVRDHAQVYWYPAGCYVVEQGEPSRELFVILSGHADVWQESDDGSRKYLRQMGPGEFFGELGVAGGRVRSAHVVATEGLTCLVFSPEAPTLFAGRGEGARLPGKLPGAAERAERAAGGVDAAAGPPEATAELDVTAQIEAKVGALCAYRSQFALEPDMFPGPLLREMFGKEYFVQVMPPRQADTELL